MSNLTNILGSLIQSGLSPSGKNALGAGRDSSSGGLSDILSNLTQNTANSSGSGGGLGDILGGAIGEIGRSLGSGNKVAAGGLGALVGSIFGGGSSSVKGAMGGGVMAVLASLAYSALQKSGAASDQPPVSLLENPTNVQKEEIDNEANLIIRAMLNAAKADGEVDGEEMQRIIGKVQEDGIDENEAKNLQEEMQKPFDLVGLVARVGDNKQLAAQIYIASLLAIEVDTAIERQYMSDLATGMDLSADTVAQIKMTMGLA